MTGPRVVLVTGATSGIGRACAHLLAERGDHLVLASRSEDSLDEVVKECDARGAASTASVPTDVGDDDAVAALVAETVRTHRRIDAVVHAAGVVAYGRTEEVPREVFDGVLRTNLVGSVNVARHVVPQLREQREGVLVLVGSVIGHVTVPGMSPYVLSKWGVRSLARQLHVENLDLPGVHVCHVAPGGVDTPIYQQAANVVGIEGRPPPPVMETRKAAELILRRLDDPKPRTQLTPANHLLRAGFTFTPALYDHIVGPLFRRIGLDAGKQVLPTAGNVLGPRVEGNALAGSSSVFLNRVVSAPGALARRVVGR